MVFFSGFYPINNKSTVKTVYKRGTLDEIMGGYNLSTPTNRVRILVIQAH